ncbi:MAG: Spore coat associated protein [Firmicutes bacterium]|nr:Spore coat associated protein [Bacillota bacterium]
MYKKNLPQWSDDELEEAMPKQKMMWLDDCAQEDYMEDSCFEDRMPENKMCDDVALAHAYVPWQCYKDAFSPKEALMRGTLFPELWGVYPIPE